MAVPVEVIRTKKFNKETGVGMKEVQKQEESYEDKAYKEELSRLKAQREDRKERKQVAVGKFKARVGNLGTVAATKSEAILNAYLKERARKKLIARKARMSVEDKIIAAQARSEAMARAGYNSTNVRGGYAQAQMRQPSIFDQPQQQQSILVQQPKQTASLFTGGGSGSLFTKGSSGNTGMYSGGGGKSNLFTGGGSKGGLYTQKKSKKGFKFY